jgi:hypothetical protein
MDPFLSVWSSNMFRKYRNLVRFKTFEKRYFQSSIVLTELNFDSMKSKTQRDKCILMILKKCNHDINTQPSFWIFQNIFLQCNFMKWRWRTWSIYHWKIKKAWFSTLSSHRCFSPFESRNSSSWNLQKLKSLDKISFLKSRILRILYELNSRYYNKFKPVKRSSFNKQRELAPPTKIWHSHSRFHFNKMFGTLENAAHDV